VFNKDLAKNIRFQQKQVMQLYSKTRFIAAQYEAILKDETWKRVASHANNMASLLASKLKEIPQVKVTRLVQANVVFAELPEAWNEPLMSAFPFYVWKEERNEVRLMCAWDTKPEEIEAFTAKMQSLAT
jgi:threonine aldolase